MYHSLSTLVQRGIMRVILLTIALLVPLFLVAPTNADEGVRGNNNPSMMPPLRQKIVQGAHIPPIWQNNTEIQAFNDLIGKDLGIVMSFYVWSYQFGDGICEFFDNTYRHRDDGGVPGTNDCMQYYGPDTPEISTTYMIAWEPSHNPTGNLACNVAPNHRTDLNAILNGSCNAYIDDFARRLKGWHDRFGDRFMLLFMDEMNISAVPWWRDDPNYPAQYRQTFQYVVNRFRAQGATSEMAQFVWSPNYMGFPARNWNVIPNYYPGDEYVDWVGVSGFNWYGVSGQDPSWRTFDSLFVDPLPDLSQGVLPFFHCNYAKPIVMTEFGTVDGPGGDRTKAAWVADAYERMLDFPFVQAAVWFNDYANSDSNYADFRVTYGSSDMDRGNAWPPAPGWHQSLGSVTDAYRNAISGDRYIDTMPPLSDIKPQSTYCGSFPPVYVPPTVTLPTSLLAEEGETKSMLIQGQNIQGTYNLSVTGVTGGLNVQVSPSQISPANPNATVTVRVPNGISNASFTITGQSAGLDPFSNTTNLRVYDELQRSFLPLSRR
jgi:hypothetical protein